MALGGWVSRVIDTDTNTTQGRWSWMKFQCTQGRILRIISVYQLNPGQPSTDRRSYTQQYQIKLNEGNPAPEPRRQAIIDLTTFITKCQEAKEEIILCIDANAVVKEQECDTTTQTIT